VAGFFFFLESEAILHTPYEIVVKRPIVCKSLNQKGIPPVRGR
jgi:hypothetical protein